MIVTMGGQGAVYADQNGGYGVCPAMKVDVVDTTGAGDAFFAAAGMFVAAGAPTEIGTFAGNIGGALGANIVGNKEAIEKINVLKYASTLMNV